ncbi:ribonuclease P protein component [Halocola ammonii]
MIQEKEAKRTFPKKERLKSRKAIEALFSDGQKIKSFPVMLFWNKGHHDCGHPLKVGVSVSKRKVRKAVHRNRIKRLMREAYRLNKSKLETFLSENNEQHLDVMFIYADKEMPTFADIEPKIKRLLDRLIKDLNQ